MSETTGCWLASCRWGFAMCTSNQHTLSITLVSNRNLKVGSAAAVPVAASTPLLLLTAAGSIILNLLPRFLPVMLPLPAGCALPATRQHMHVVTDGHALSRCKHATVDIRPLHQHAARQVYCLTLSLTQRHDALQRSWQQLFAVLGLRRWRQLLCHARLHAANSPAELDHVLRCTGTVTNTQSGMRERKWLPSAPKITLPRFRRSRDERSASASRRRLPFPLDAIDRSGTSGQQCQAGVSKSHSSRGYNAFWRHASRKCLASLHVQVDRAPKVTESSGTSQSSSVAVRAVNDLATMMLALHLNLCAHETVEVPFNEPQCNGMCSICPPRSTSKGTRQAPSGYCAYRDGSVRTDRHCTHIGVCSAIEAAAGTRRHVWGQGLRSSAQVIMAPKKRRAAEITRPAKRQSTSRRSSVEPRQPPPTLQHPSHGTVGSWQSGSPPACTALITLAHLMLQHNSLSSNTAASVVAPRCSTCVNMHTRMRFMHAAAAQVSARVFVHGTGDCGQLGLGEDEMERKQPTPVDLSGRKVGCWALAIAIAKPCHLEGPSPHLPHRQHALHKFDEALKIYVSS
jgi:hypothetical protein